MHFFIYYSQVIDAKTPQAAIGVESDDVRMDSRSVTLYDFHSPYAERDVNACRMLKDERVKEDPARSLFNQDLTDRLG